MLTDNTIFYETMKTFNKLTFFTNSETAIRVRRGRAKPRAPAPTVFRRKRLPNARKKAAARPAHVSPQIYSPRPFAPRPLPVSQDGPLPKSPAGIAATAHRFFRIAPALSVKMNQAQHLTVLRPIHI